MEQLAVTLRKNGGVELRKASTTTTETHGDAWDRYRCTGKGLTQRVHWQMLGGR
jgi:hypothetical protein